MEQKKMMIVPPEGYEIDTENSTFECIKFKPIHKDLTMGDVWENISSRCSDDLCLHSLGSLSGRHAKVSAYAALSDIAEYYNQGWKPDLNDLHEEKYYIVFSKKGDIYVTEHREVYIPASIPFKNINDAQAVIDNSNFRNILDTLFK